MWCSTDVPDVKEWPAGGDVCLSPCRVSCVLLWSSRRSFDLPCFLPPVSGRRYHRAVVLHYSCACVGSYLLRIGISTADPFTPSLISLVVLFVMLAMMMLAMFRSGLVHTSRSWCGCHGDGVLCAPGLPVWTIEGWGFLWISSAPSLTQQYASTGQHTDIMAEYF